MRTHPRHARPERVCAPVCGIVHSRHLCNAQGGRMLLHARQLLGVPEEPVKVIVGHRLFSFPALEWERYLAARAMGWETDPSDYANPLHEIHEPPLDVAQVSAEQALERLRQMSTRTRQNLADRGVRLTTGATVPGEQFLDPNRPLPQVLQPRTPPSPSDGSHR